MTLVPGEFVFTVNRPLNKRMFRLALPYPLLPCPVLSHPVLPRPLLRHHVVSRHILATSLAASHRAASSSCPASSSHFVSACAASRLCEALRYSSTPSMTIIGWRELSITTTCSRVHMHDATRSDPSALHCNFEVHFFVNLFAGPSKDGLSGEAQRRSVLRYTQQVEPLSVYATRGG